MNLGTTKKAAILKRQKREGGTGCGAEIEKQSLHLKMHHQSPAKHMTNYIFSNTTSEYTIQYFISKRMFSSSGNNQSDLFFFPDRRTGEILPTSSESDASYKKRHNTSQF